MRQFVAHVGQKLRFVPACHLQLAALFLKLAEQPGVLDREHRLRGEGLQEIHRVLREEAGFLPPNHERAQDLIFAQ